MRVHEACFLPDRDSGTCFRIWQLWRLQDGWLVPGVGQKEPVREISGILSGERPDLVLLKLRFIDEPV